MWDVGCVPDERTGGPPGLPLARMVRDSEAAGVKMALDCVMTWSLG